jgi:hypothetical protein
MVIAAMVVAAVVASDWVLRLLWRLLRLFVTRP